MFPTVADRAKCSSCEHLNGQAFEPTRNAAARPNGELYFRTDIPPENVFQALGRLRSQAAAEIERLMAFLDETEGDPDFEPAGDEGEPELGSVEGRKGFDQSTWSAGADQVDGDEPSLGASENHPSSESFNWTDAPYRTAHGSQLGWSTGNVDDREHCADREEDDSHDGREPDVENEPSLGSFDRR